MNQNSVASTLWHALWHGFHWKTHKNNCVHFHHNSWRKVNGLHAYDAQWDREDGSINTTIPKSTEVGRGCATGCSKSSDPRFRVVVDPSVVFIVIWDKNNTRSFQSSKDMVGRSCHQQSAPHHNMTNISRGFCLCRQNPNPSLVSSVEWWNEFSLVSHKCWNSRAQFDIDFRLKLSVTPFCCCSILRNCVDRMMTTKKGKQQHITNWTEKSVYSFKAGIFKLGFHASSVMLRLSYHAMAWNSFVK